MNLSFSPYGKLSDHMSSEWLELHCELIEEAACMYTDFYLIITNEESDELTISKALSWENSLKYCVLGENLVLTNSDTILVMFT